LAMFFPLPLCFANVESVWDLALGFFCFFLFVHFATRLGFESLAIFPSGPWEHCLKPLGVFASSVFSPFFLLSLTIFLKKGSCFVFFSLRVRWIANGRFLSFDEVCSPFFFYRVPEKVFFLGPVGRFGVLFLFLPEDFLMVESDFALLTAGCFSFFLLRAPVF